MTGRYATEDLAFRRVRVLQQHGTWPGVILHGDGSASLTFDPYAPLPAEDDQ